MLTKTDHAGAMVDQTKVLVVEDTTEFQQMLEASLSSAGFSVVFAGDGESALQRAEADEPDVVVLDLGLPGIDGVEVCRRLRTFSDAYVIMLTSRDGEVDRLIGLAVVADDYMSKPFSTRELVARVHALMRRPRQRRSDLSGKDDVLVVGSLRVNPSSRQTWVDGLEVSLTKTEFDLLNTLIQRPDMVFTKEMLLEQVWGSEWERSDHLVQVHVANLRGKIDIGDTSLITSVRSVGYRLAMVTEPTSN